MTFAPVNAKTAYLPTTEHFSKDQDAFLTTLTGTYTNIAQSVNVREIGIYEDNTAVMTGQQFSTPGNAQRKKNVFRKMFYFGPIAAGAFLAIGHGITGATRFTNIYGTVATAVPDNRPIPFPSVNVVTNGISVTVGAVQAQINNGGTAPNITSGVLILEYLLD